MAKKIGRKKTSKKTASTRAMRKTSGAKGKKAGTKNKKGRNQQGAKIRRMGSKKKTKNQIPTSEDLMRFVGIDLHKRSLTVCTIDKKGGKTFGRRFRCCDEERIRAFFEGIRPFQAVIEASATYEWLWELLEPLADRLVLAHPKKIRIIADSMKKDDRHDAHFLAWLLAHDAVPEAYRPTPRQRQYQILVKHRHSLVQTRSRLRTQLRSLLANRNLDYRSLFTRSGTSYLEGLDLRPAERFRVQELLRSLENLETQIRDGEEELKRFRREAPATEQRQHAIVKSVPGIGDLIGDVVLATLGDIRRFPSLQKVTSYSGLVPGYRKSDQKKHELHITKEGPRILRWALVQGAWRAIQFSPHWRSIYERLSGRRGKKIAIIAVARRLLGVIYTLLTNDTMYKEKPVKGRISTNQILKQS
jgi:transposase